MTPDMRRYVTVGLGLLLCVAIFLADILTPVELDAWLGFLALVSAIAWFSTARISYFFAALSTALTLAVYWLTPPTEDAWVTLVNRVGAVTLLWAATYLINHRRRMLIALADQAESLRRANVFLEQKARELSEANEALREVPARLVEVQENERRTISRELHDESGQLLSAIFLRLDLLRKSLQGEQTAVGQVDQIRQIATRLADGLHRLAVSLRPVSLDQAGLVEALRQYVESCRRVYGINVEMIANGLDHDRLAPELESSLYRITQEALTNVARYAHASHVSVLLNLEPDEVTMMVEDDGAGFDVQAAQRSGRLGLTGMKERAELRGGTLTIESAPGEGTTVVARIPCPSMATSSQVD
jgi:signal transduction histidine kinase